MRQPFNTEYLYQAVAQLLPKEDGTPSVRLVKPPYILRRSVRNMVSNTDRAAHSAATVQVSRWFCTRALPLAAKRIYIILMR